MAPGLVDTELHARSTGEPGRIERMLPVIPYGRAAAPEEIAEAILWLLSDAATGLARPGIGGFAISSMPTLTWVRCARSRGT